MACPIAWSDVEEIVIGRVDDEATVTAEGEAEGGDEAIVTGRMTPKGFKGWFKPNLKPFGFRGGRR